MNVGIVCSEFSFEQNKKMLSRHGCSFIPCLLVLIFTVFTFACLLFEMNN